MRRAMYVVAAVIAVWPIAALAQNAEAEQLFEEADRLMAAGKLTEACAAFEGSNRIEARAGTLIRLGDCREKNQQLASAWSAYKDALSRVKDPRKRETAQAAVKALEPRLSKLTVQVPAAARVAGLSITRNGKLVDEALWDRAVAVDGGESTIVASAPGRKTVTLKASVPVEKGNVDVAIPVLADDAAPVASTPPPIVTTAPDPIVTAPVPDERSRGTFTTRRKIAVGVAVLGAGGIALGSVFGLRAKKLEDDAFALCMDFDEPCSDAPRAQAKLDDASSRALLSNVMFGVGIVGIAGAAVLWFTGAPESSSRVVVRPSISSDGVGFAIGGRL